MKVTLKDIAEESGVSLGTASLAINNRPGVNAETRRRVLEIAERNGYQPSMNARTLSTRESNLIGLLVPNLTNLVYSTLVQGIESLFRDMGYRMIIATTGNNENYEKAMIEQFVSFRVDGVILYPSIAEINNPHYLDILRKNDIPLVFIGGYYKGIGMPHCMSDIYNGVKEILSHLRAQGYKKIIYMGGCKTIVSNQMKIQAFRDFFSENEIEFNESDYIELSNTNYENALEATQLLVSQHKNFDAVLTGDAYSAFGVFNALKEKGITVPDEIGIAHIDNLLEEGIEAVKMTCLEQNLDSMISDTVGMLMDMIKTKETPDSKLIKTKLVIRDSTNK